VDPLPLERAWDLVVQRGAPAQLCVIHDGNVVLDRSYRCEPDALFWIFSAGKPYTAMLVHLLAERGELALDDPVSRWWPEFAQHGKGGITIRHVLQHRAGLPTAGSFLGDALAIADWDRSVRRIERAHPRWPAGEVPAYEILTFGFILGELVRRVTGVPVAELLRTEILEPLGVGDTYLGLPDSAWSRHVPLRIRGPLGLPAQVVLNQQRTRRAVIPSAGISTTARDLAAFYDMLLNDGRVRGAAAGGKPSDAVILLPDPRRSRPRGSRRATTRSTGSRASRCAGHKASSSVATAARLTCAGASGASTSPGRSGTTEAAAASGGPTLTRGSRSPTSATGSTVDARGRTTSSRSPVRCSRRAGPDDRSHPPTTPRNTYYSRGMPMIVGR